MHKNIYVKYFPAFSNKRISQKLCFVTIICCNNHLFYVIIQGVEALKKAEPQKKYR